MSLATHWSRCVLASQLLVLSKQLGQPAAHREVIDARILAFAFSMHASV